jgi:hypothetical protein
MKMCVAIFFLVCCVGLACQTVPEGANTKYFPENVFRPPSFPIDARARVYAAKLSVMHESPLFPPNELNGEQIYRVLRVSPFFSTITVRLQIQSDGSAESITKIRDYRAPHQVVEAKAKVSAENINEFVMRVTRGHFWTLVSRGSIVDPDGTIWVLEGVRNHEYHVVERQAVGEEDFIRACKYLIETIGNVPRDDPH